MLVAYGRTRWSQSWYLTKKKTLQKHTKFLINRSNMSSSDQAHILLKYFLNGFKHINNEITTLWEDAPVYSFRFLFFACFLLLSIIYQWWTFLTWPLYVICYHFYYKSELRDEEAHSIIACNLHHTFNIHLCVYMYTGVCCIYKTIFETGNLG